MTEDELAALFVETGHRHHEAYLESDGVDPECVSWYAAYVQAHMWDRLGRLLSRSEIGSLILRADAEVRANPQNGDDWPHVYARVLLGHVASTI